MRNGLTGRRYILRQTLPRQTGIYIRFATGPVCAQIALTYTRIGMCPFCADSL